MTVAGERFLAAAESAVALLADPAVTAAWDMPSALAEFRVSGLAGHLAGQVVRVQQLIEAGPSAESPISLVDHYVRAPWVASELDDDVNVGIREGGEKAAADGAAALVARTDAVLADVRVRLQTVSSDLVVYLSWTGWALTLDDFLTTRLLELLIHADDLAVSVGIDTPALPVAVHEPVVTLLTELAVRKHGPTAVLRALSRAERAPGIAAI